MTTFLKVQQELDTPKLSEQFYQGTVVDNNDPKKLRRVKVRINEIHGTEQDIPDKHIPWSIQFRPTFLGASEDLSLASIPRIGSQIIVTHINGDIYSPAYMFELYHQKCRDTKFDKNYPESYGMQDSDGNFWHTDMTDDVLDILFNGTKVMEITLDRNTTIGRDQSLNIGRDKTDTVGRNEDRSVGGNQNETVSGNRVDNVNGNTSLSTTNLSINTSANVTITAGGNIIGDASNIHWNGTGGGLINEESIDPFTGNPHVDGSLTVKCTK